MDWQPLTAERASVNPALEQVSQRTFIARVYGWMFFGLALTGLVAVYTASTDTLLEWVMPNAPLLFVAQLGLVLALSWLSRRLSGTVASVLFTVYAALNGLTLSGIFLVYRLGSIGSAFLVTAGAFGALSLYATFTRRDLSAWFSFLFIGLIGVMLAGFVQLLWPNPELSFVWSCACVVVFAGLTAYDTQKLRVMHLAGGYTAQGSLAILGALQLYLDFINLFLSLLRLFGRRK
jgi:hypothetical protein